MTTNNNLTAILRKALLMILFITATTFTYSQQYVTGSIDANPLSDDNEDVYEELLPEDPDPLNVPLDGGVSIILAAAGIAGAKKLKERRNKKNDSNIK